MMNNSIGEILVNGEKYKLYPLNRNGSGKLLDLSSMKDTIKKVEFTEKFLQDYFVNDTLDGVIIKRNYSYKKFEEFENEYESYKFEYRPNGGLVLIVEYQPVGIGQGRCVAEINSIMMHLNFKYITDVICALQNISISVSETDQSSSTIFTCQPDLSFGPIKPTRFPTVFFETAFTRSTTNLVNKLFIYSSNKNIEMGIGLRIFPKQDGASKMVAFVYKRVLGVLTCTSIISFGSCRTTQQDEATFLKITSSNDNSILCGVLSTNNIINNTPNTPPFTIEIPMKILLPDPTPQLLVPGTDVTCIIDLNDIRKSLEEINVPFTYIVGSDLIN